MIDEVFQLVNFISDKEGRGYIPPAKFNLVAKVCQLEFVSSRLGNLKQLGPNGVPSYGYKSNRRVDMDLRPFLYGPEIIPINNQGNFNYPYNYMWPDSWSKLNSGQINEIDNDEYPFIKNNLIIPPTSDDPIIIFDYPYGFVDPYSIGSFRLKYLRRPPDPMWGYTVVNDEPVYNPATTQDFLLDQISFMDITALILEKIGINLDKPQLFQYAQQKQIQGT